MVGNKNNTRKIVGCTVARGSTCGPSHFFLDKLFSLSVSILSTCAIILKIREYTWVTVVFELTSSFGCYRYFIIHFLFHLFLDKQLSFEFTDNYIFLKIIHFIQ